MRRTAELGLMLAIALILSYVESLIPFSFGIPGIKLGLPNLIVLLLLYEKPKTGGKREALLVNSLRIVLSGFLFSNLYAILYALAGAAFSFAAMVLGRRTRRFSMVGARRRVPQCGAAFGGDGGGGDLCRFLLRALSACGWHGDGGGSRDCGHNASALSATDLK